MSNFNLYYRFEDALIHFHTTLTQAKQHYEKLFHALLDGQSIHNDLVNDVYFKELQRTQYVLQEEQRRMSRLAGNYDSLISVSDIKSFVGDKFNSDVVTIAKECVESYEHIVSYIQSIEKYFGSKITEYRSFFNRVYSEVNDNHLYNEHGNIKKDKQGILIHTKA